MTTISDPDTPQVGSRPESRARPQSAERWVRGAVTGILGWAASVFQRIEVVGGPIPEGPVLVTANHLNALLDPLIIFHVAGRPTSPLAKAPLFDQLVVGTMLRVLGGLPVYRRQDDPTLMDRNEDTFRGAIAALHRGAAIQIFPEGKSHSEPALEPLRTGAARIALRAEAEVDGALGLQIVPVGLTYEGKQFFRSRVIAEIGEPFPVAPWLPAYREHEVEAVRGLTDEIAARLRDVTLNLERPEDRPLLEAAARMYTREKRLHGWREREGLVEHIPRLRRMAVRLEWLRDSDPERYERLAQGVREYERIARAAGAKEGEVPPRYAWRPVARYVIHEGVALVVGLPLAVIGTVVWYPTWLAPHWVVPRIDPVPESVATYKLATGMALAPLTVVLVSLVAWWLWGWIGALVAAIATPVAGLVALSWRERWGRVREDTLLFFRVLRRPRFRERMQERRQELVREFDRIVEETDGPSPI